MVNAQFDIPVAEIEDCSLSHSHLFTFPEQSNFTLLSLQVMFPNQSNAFSTSLSRSVNSGDFQSGAEGPAGGRTQANSRGGKRGNFPKNVVPVDIKTILHHREDDGPLMVHGIEVGLVSLVAQIRDVFTDDAQSDSRSVTFVLDDDTGSIQAVQYLQDETPPVVPVRNTWAKIIGINVTTNVNFSTSVTGRASEDWEGPEHADCVPGAASGVQPRDKCSPAGAGSPSSQVNTGQRPLHLMTE